MNCMLLMNIVNVPLAGLRYCCVALLAVSCTWRSFSVVIKKYALIVISFIMPIVVYNG